MAFVFYSTLLVLTTLFWGVLFYKKDYHPQPFRVILQIFGVGLFSMIPVFAYKMVYQRWLPGLAEYQIFRPLLAGPLAMGLATFLSNLVMLSLILFTLGGAVTLILNFFDHQALRNIKSALRQEPLGFTVVSLLLGLAVATQSWVREIWGSSMMAGALGSILFLAIIEEYVKHLMVRVTDDKRIKDVDDAITLSIVAGLAFAFVETVVYALSAGDLRIVFFRTLVSLPVHVVASGLFGYFYGLAHFAVPIMKSEGGDAVYHWGTGRRQWLHRFLTFKKSTVYGEEKIIEGILVATAFHALMNLLFEINLGVVAVPIVMAGLVWVSRLYRAGQKESRMIARFSKKTPAESVA